MKGTSDLAERRRAFLVGEGTLTVADVLAWAIELDWSREARLGEWPPMHPSAVMPVDIDPRQELMVVESPQSTDPTAKQEFWTAAGDAS